MKKKRRRKRTVIRSQTLDWWTQEFWDLYKEKDKKRSIYQMWLSTIEFASKIGEDIRRSSYKELPKHLAHSFAWLLSFVAKCNKQRNIPPLFKFRDGFSDIIAFKYPNVCGICRKSECTCGLIRGAIESVTGKKPPYAKLLGLRKKFHAEENYRKKNLQGWLNMFDRVYMNTIQGLPIEHIAFHYMEEIGEVAEVITTIYEEEHKFPREIDDVRSIEEAVKKFETATTSDELRKALELKLILANEIADSFSWWCSLNLKLEHLCKETRGTLIPVKNVQKIILSEYKYVKGHLRCPVCEEIHCKCDILKKKRFLEKFI